MKLEGTYTFDAPRDEVWKALLDPEVLAKVMPGCEKLEQTGDDEYKAALKIKVGPVQGNFQGSVKLTDIIEPESYVMQVDGKGPAGFMKGTGEVRLEDQGDTTLMRYTGTAQVGGRIASVGQRLLDSSAKALTRQSLEGLYKQVQARTEPPISGNGSATPSEAAAGTAAAAQTRNRPQNEAQVEAPSQLEFAMGVGKNMLEDLVPADRRPVLIAAGFGFLALFLFLYWWSNIIASKVANEIWERR